MQTAAGIETYYNLVGNSWVKSEGGETFEDESPAFKGTILARFQLSGSTDIVHAVETASEAFLRWRKTSLEERRGLILNFLQLLANRRQELAVIVSRENGKTLRESLAEIDSALAEGNYHAAQITRFCGHTLPTGTVGQCGWVEYHPIGVVGIISPWNFPVNVMCRKTLPALLTGNTVVFKPASFTPWSGVFMGHLFQEAGLPEGVFNCVTGSGSTVGNALVDEPCVRAISFTGSTAVGKKIQERAAKNLTRTQLELGGKNAVIIMADADLNQALDAVVSAGFACAGQWCTSTSRLLLHQAIHDRFLGSLVARCEGLRVGDPLDEETQMGPVAGAEQYQSIRTAIERAEAEGAHLMTGGPASGELGRRGYFILPTVLSRVTPQMAAFREEIFGPVLAVTAFESLDDALRLANDSEFALSSAIFTRSLDYSQKYIRDIETGLAHVNVGTGFKHPSLPFGGWKDSGFGLPENSQTGLEFFVDRKAVYIKSAGCRV